MAGATETSDEPKVLDLRNLVGPRQRVLTSVGEFGLRTLPDLGAIDRTLVNQAMLAAERMVPQLQEAQAAGDMGRVEELALQLAGHEDELLRMALPDSTRDQRDAMPSTERAGVMAAFFGADAEGTRQAASALVQALAMAPPGIGAKRSRGSKRSTAATRTAG